MIAENISVLKSEIDNKAKLVIVSKYRSIEEILLAYNTGHRVFAENRVQALLERKEALPGDIEWHLIGHLQSNKVKYIAPFISCVQSIDSLKLLRILNKEAKENGRVIDCLLQLHIAKEETKFGMNEKECLDVLQKSKLENLNHVNIIGLMGMASFTNNTKQVKDEFTALKKFYDSLKGAENFKVLSMGMSSDYKIAIECGSNLVRIGSKVFE
ncbi:MAG: YggS family pyridoxal phosphate-dependent enzyme [Bacteroidia bacterium]